MRHPGQRKICDKETAQAADKDSCCIAALLRQLSSPDAASRSRGSIARGRGGGRGGQLHLSKRQAEG